MPYGIGLSVQWPLGTQQGNGKGCHCGLKVFVNMGYDSVLTMFFSTSAQLGCIH